LTPIFFFYLLQYKQELIYFIYYWEVLQIKYDTNISKLYGVYKHTEENDQVHHIKKGKGNKWIYWRIIFWMERLFCFHSAFDFISMCEC